MVSQNHPSFSLLFVASCILFLASSGAHARFRNVNRWCKTADYRRICTMMVNNANTQDEALTNAVRTTLNRITKLKPQLNNLGADLSNLGNLSKESVVSTCTESYENAEDDLKEALIFIHQKDQGSIEDRLGTAESSFLECSNALKEKRGTSPLGRTTNMLYKYASNCLAVATQL